MAGDPNHGRTSADLPGAEGSPLGGGAVGSGEAAPIRVLICDDHEVLRHGLRAVLLRAPDLAVVAEAAGAAEALRLAGQFRPDVTVVGLGGGGAGGGGTPPAPGRGGGPGVLARGA